MRKLVWLLPVALLLSVAAVAQDIPTQSGVWASSDSARPLDGGRIVMRSLISSNQPSDMLGQPSRGLLILRCRDGWVSIIVSTLDGRFGFSSVIRVDWRVDEMPIVRENWSYVSADTVIHSGRSLKKFLSAIRGGKELVFRVYGDGMTQDIAFDLGDGAAAVDAIKAACPKAG